MWPVWFSDARLALWLLLASSLAFRIVPLSLILLQLVVCVAAVSCSVTFYIHTTRTVFNRRPPWAFLPFWRHFMMTRPLEVLWRFLTVPFRVYPDFLILGEVRTGTTSAAAYLRTLGCLGPFSPWIHPLATDKESFYFVGHYWGLVHPGAYRMCFPLKISIWWHEFWHGERPLVFDACASHLSAPWAPALLWQACPKAALLVIVRQPQLQHKSWWRLETNAIAWGRAMGMGEDFLKEGYPPKTLPEAVAWSQSEEVQQLYQKGEQEVHQVLQSGQGWWAAVTSHRLPEELLPFPGGQLLAFDRMGKYAQNIHRYLRFWKREQLVIAQTKDLDESRIGLVIQRMAKILPSLKMKARANSPVKAASSPAIVKDPLYAAMFFGPPEDCSSFERFERLPALGHSSALQKADRARWMRTKLKLGFSRYSLMRAMVCDAKNSRSL